MVVSFLPVFIRPDHARKSPRTRSTGVDGAYREGDERSLGAVGIRKDMRSLPFPGQISNQRRLLSLCL